jgi:hypothetical protein
VCDYAYIFRISPCCYVNAVEAQVHHDVHCCACVPSAGSCEHKTVGRELDNLFSDIFECYEHDFENFLARFWNCYQLQKIDKLTV